MSFTSLEDVKIIVKEEGVFSYSFTAYDTIKAGQAVGVKAEGSPYAKVGPTDSDEDTSFVGVAMYDISSGSKGAIAGIGSKIYGRADASGISAGDIVAATSEGKFTKADASGVKAGIALEDTTAADEAFKILLI